MLLLLLLREWHQSHCPAHKLHNLPRAVCVILTVQYQQKPSADTVKSQRTARCRPQSNNKPFNVGEFVLYVIYGTRVVVSCHKSRNALLTNIIMRNSCKIPNCKLCKMLSTTTNNNNVYNLENQCYTVAPLRQQQLIIHWSGHGLVNKLGVDGLGQTGAQSPKRGW